MWFHRLRDNPEYETNSHLVFVYGSLKGGFINDEFLALSRFVCETHTEDFRFEMKSITGLFPAVRNGQFRIQGEVYEITGHTLWHLDRLEGEGDFYKRTKVKVEGIDDPVWMYLLNTDSRDLFLPGCDHVHTDLDNLIQKWII